MAFLSNFYEWDQKVHADDFSLFPDNIGPYLSIDETSLSQGELYTIVTNKEAKGRKGALVAILKGVDADKIIPILTTIKKIKRLKVKEITLESNFNISKKQKASHFCETF
ncbi:MAG: transposase [Bacteroidota bacterium]|nr:transposase [Bacteroidota bacterium]